MLPCLDDFVFMKSDFGQCVMPTQRVERDFVRAGLNIDMPKFCLVPSQQLGFDVNFEAWKFQIPEDEFVALKASVEVILTSRHGRVQPSILASVTETVLYMHLSCDVEVCAIYGGHV